MATSIIDYIFRELSISYMGRDDLAHISEEDLRHDVLHTPNERPEVLEEHEFVLRGAKDAESMLVSNSPIDVDAPPAGHASAGSKTETPKSLQIQAVLDAKAKGYEGDACTACGALTMVRNGSCLKCMSCGETSGCS